MKSLADMMGKVLKETGSAGVMNPIWARVVGEVVAKHTRPLRWEGKTLVIRCDGEAWRQALEPERVSLSRKLAAAMGESSAPPLVFEVTK
jgi:predicted nucleic acid-binding Zn ribbon protein